MKNLLEQSDFGPVLRQFRLAAGITQEALAARLGYATANYVSCLEIGTRKPTVELLFKIAAALGVEASQIIIAMEKLRKCEEQAGLNAGSAAISERLAGGTWD